MKAAIFLLAGMLLASTPARVSIHVTPHVLLKGGAVRVTCKVPVDPRNRVLAIGINPYTFSEHPLDEYARVTYEETFTHVPCGAAQALCVVSGIDGEHQAVTPLQVGGCE